MWSFTGHKGVQGEMNKWLDVKKNSLSVGVSDFNHIYSIFKYLHFCVIKADTFSQTQRSPSLSLDETVWQKQDGLRIHNKDSNFKSHELPKDCFQFD